MELVYVFFLLVLPLTNLYLNLYDRSGLLPFHFGYVGLSNISHILFAILSVWYLGWLWGIIIFLLYFFGIFDYSFAWWIRYLYMRKKTSLSMPIYNFYYLSILSQMVFTIVSFFIADFEQLRDSIEWHIWREGYLYITIVAIVMATGFAFHLFFEKIVIAKELNKEA